MKNIILIISIHLFLLICCNQDINKKKVEIITINNLSLTDKINLSNISSSELIPLQTPDSIIIDEVLKLSTTNENLFIADKFSLYKFDRQGNFITSFNKSGIGPNEYINITDFYLQDNDDFWILSRSNQCIYHFNWQGELIAQHTFNFWIDRFFKFESFLYLYLGNETDGSSHKIKKYSLKENKIIDSYFTIDPVKAKYLHIHNTNIVSYNSKLEKLFFFETFNDTIYEIKNDGIYPYQYIFFNGKNIPQNLYRKGYNNIFEFFQELFKYSYAYGTTLFMELEQDYLISYIYDKKKIFALINKNTFQVTLFDILYEDSALFGYPINLTLNNTFIQIDNKLAIILDSMDIMHYATENLTEEQQTEIRRRIRYDTNIMNPVVLLLNVSS